MMVIGYELNKKHKYLQMSVPLNALLVENPSFCIWCCSSNSF